MMAYRPCRVWPAGCCALPLTQLCCSSLSYLSPLCSVPHPRSIPSLSVLSLLSPCRGPIPATQQRSPARSADRPVAGSSALIGWDGAAAADRSERLACSGPPPPAAAAAAAAARCRRPSTEQ